MCAYDMWRQLFEIKGEMGKWSYKGGGGRWCVADWTVVAGGGHCNAAGSREGDVASGGRSGAGHGPGDGGGKASIWYRDMLQKYVRDN